MTEILRLALVQMRCEKADIDGNLSVMQGYLAEARERRIDIVVFPEMNVTGYVRPMSHPEVCLDLEDREVRRLLEMTANFDGTVLAGIIEHNPDGKPFVTQLAIRNGDLVGFYRKRHIVDEEEDWFSAGTDPIVFDHESFRIGVAICADIDNAEVFGDVATLGARIVMECAAPGLYGEQANRNWQSGFDWWRNNCAEKLGRYAAAHGIWIAVATQAGRTRDEDFPGGGYVFSPTGDLLYRSPDWSEGAAYLEIDLSKGLLREL